MHTGVSADTGRGRWLQHPAVIALPSIVLLWLTSWRSLFDPGLWFDEAYTVDFGNRPLGELWTLITQYEPQMSGQYLLMKAWLPFSDSDAWARMPSLLALSAALIVAAVLVLRISGSRAAAVAATVCIAAFPDLRWFAADARGYALSILLILLTVVFATQPGPAPTTLRLRPVLMGVTVGLALTLNVFTAFVFLPLLIAVLLHPGRLRNIGRLALSAVLAGLILMPFVRPFATSQAVNWIQPIPRVDWAQNLSNTPLWIDRGLLAVAVVVGITGVLGLFGGDIVGTARNARSGGVVVLVGLLALMPLFMLAVLSDLVRPLLIPRYVSYSLPFALIGLVLIVQPWWSKSTRWGVARVTALALAVLITSWVIWPPQEHRRIADEYRAASRYVVGQASPTDVVIANTVPNTLVRYGVPLERPVTPSTSRLWVISYGPLTLEQVRSIANANGLAITSLSLSESAFGSAAVQSVEVRPLAAAAASAP